MDEAIHFNFLLPKAQSFLKVNGVNIIGVCRGGTFKKGLMWWKEILQLTRNNDRKKDFESTLNNELRKSWGILREWWDCRHLWSHCARDDYAVLRLLQSTKEEDNKSPYNTTTYKTYEKVLARLLWVEMVWYQELEQFDGQPLGRVTEGIKERLVTIKDMAHTARADGLRWTVWQMIGITSYRVAECPSWNPDEKLYMASTLEACPWLNLGDRAFTQQPRYLWDRYERKTVATQDLQGLPYPYYCISHTWGRWRTTAVQVPGVDWPVPGNKRFDVSELPEILHSVQWPVKYIWIDLFCIPQNECLEQAGEIAKQADIFRLSDKTIVWINDILGWKFLENVIIWLGLNFLHRTNSEDFQLRNAFEIFTRDFNGSLARLAGDDKPLNPWCPLPEAEPQLPEKQTAYQDDPGPKWFSSLWTVQEAYLCPSALLADRNWNFLTLGKGMVITLDNLASLANSYLDVKDVQTPSMVEMLMFSINRWELANLGKPDRNAILTAAESRWSTSSRAQAIMSALGFTSWYNDHVNEYRQAPPQVDLVLDLYPVEFLREAHRKIGGTFWLHSRFPEYTAKDVDPIEPLGSLLPIASRKRQWRVAIAGFSTQSANGDPLTGNWKIQPDGTVVVTQAAILAQSGKNQPEIKCGKVQERYGTSIKDFESLESWMASFPPTPYRVAVAVVLHHNDYTGVLLEGRQSGLGDGRLFLVKTGTFRNIQRGLTKDEVKLSEVDWLVM